MSKLPQGRKPLPNEWFIDKANILAGNTMSNDMKIRRLEERQCDCADWADGVDNSPYDLFAKELKELINTHCLENLTDTPDYILAAYIVEALKALENLHHAKRIWKK